MDEIDSNTASMGLGPTHMQVGSRLTFGQTPTPYFWRISPETPMGVSTGGYGMCMVKYYEKTRIVLKIYIRTHNLLSNFT